MSGTIPNLHIEGLLIMPTPMGRRVAKLEDRIYSDSDRLVMAVRHVDCLPASADGLDEQLDAMQLPCGCAVYLTTAAVEPVGHVRLRDLKGAAEQAWFAATAAPHALVLQEPTSRLRLLFEREPTDAEMFRALADLESDDIPVAPRLVRVN